VKHIGRNLLGIAMVGLLAAAPLLAGGRGVAPSPKDKCPVCGMFVAKYPDWLATITFTGAPPLFFDGPKDLFTYLQSRGSYSRNQAVAAIETIQVHDYYSLKPIDARSAYFVIGSDVFGPMGKELVPFAKAAEAQEFSRDHQGKKLLSFGEVTPQVLKGLH
jgi:nitrous oxide reductase accessory protein NosL